MAEYEIRLAALLEQYPDDHPWVVEGLLADWRIAAAASATLAEAARERAFDARMRAIMREELDRR